MKLLIVDDERVICETISTIIDWPKYNIDILPPCLNGLDAYDVIVDELPEIVITDIRMPGCDGIELIKRIKDLQLDTQFILLSGFSEFSYAKEAMQYGVKHYLLKPCNEAQIIEAITKCSADYYELRQLNQLKDARVASLDNMQQNMLFGILNDAVYSEENYDNIILSYEPYIDFYTVPYQLFYVYYLQPSAVDSFLEALKNYCHSRISPFSIHGIYVKNTLILFQQNYAIGLDTLNMLLDEQKLARDKTAPYISTAVNKNLYELLKEILPKVTRYEAIYFMNNFRLLYTCNYSSVAEKLNTYYQRYSHGDVTVRGEILELFENISDVPYFKLLLSSFILQLTHGTPIALELGFTDWLLEIEQESRLDVLRPRALAKINEALTFHHTNSHLSDVTQQICTIVRQHLSDPNITLKSISEHYLFMNVDYVSKKFQKEMGIKFSKYITGIRIEKAKEYLHHAPDMRIQDIAEKIGYYNNPHYFSQLFKKETGLTPSAYIATLKETRLHRGH